MAIVSQYLSSLFTKVVQVHAWETFILVIINPVHFKILLKKQKLKHGNICKVILKTFFQNTRLSLQYAFKLE